FAQQFVNSLNNDYKSRLQGLLKLSQQQLSQTPGGAASDAQRANLLAQINRLQLDVRFPTNPAQQIDPALPPSSPASPKPVRNALFAFILALVGAIALAYGLERFDRRLRNPEELEEAYASPLLAVLPHSDDPGRLADGTAALSLDFREPFRTLRTNIELAAVDVPPRPILVSSPLPAHR